MRAATNFICLDFTNIQRLFKIKSFCSTAYVRGVKFFRKNDSE